MRSVRPALRSPRLLTYTFSAPTDRKARMVRAQISSAVAPPSNSDWISSAGTGKKEPSVERVRGFAER